MNDALNSLMAGIKPITPTEHGITVHAPQGLVLTPVALKLPLMDFQEEALAHAFRDTVNKPYAYLGLDMGLGKTPIGIAVAASLAQAGARPTLIVVPPSLRVNWTRELEKFAPWLAYTTIKGSKPTDGYKINAKADVVILGDSSLAGWADFLTGKVQGMVVDEAHRFKNTNKRSAALKQIASGIKLTKRTKDDGRVVYERDILASGDALPKMKVMMSGTPTPNGRHQEIATQVEVLGDDAWADIGGKGQFWHYYAPKVDEYARVNAHGDELYHAMVSSWFFRRLRDQVIDLPNKGRIALSIEATGTAVRDYLKAEEDLIEYLREKQDGKVSQAQIKAEALIRLGVMRRKSGEVKIAKVVEHVLSILEPGKDDAPSDGGGVFVVCENTLVIEQVVEGLKKFNPVTIAGGMSDADKDWSVQEFNAGRSRVLVGQVTAAGVGFTLHGDGRNHRVVVAQLPWTPADLKQAEDRLHRIGQTHDVIVEVMLSDFTDEVPNHLSIDQRLWAMLETKNFNSTTITDGLGEFLLSEVQDGILDSYRT